MLYFIVNPVAGYGKSKKIMLKLVNILKEKDIEFKVLRTNYPGHGREIAKFLCKENNADIVAVGGDGTVFEVASGMQDKGCMGIICAGTGNDFAKGMGIPKEPEKALDIILNKNIRKVDIGCINDKLEFINIAGMGLDVEVVKWAKKTKKFSRGMVAYTLAMLIALIKIKNFKITLEINGEEITKEIFLLVIANGTQYGGGMKVAPHAEPSDGMLDVYYITKASKFTIIKLLPTFFNGLYVKTKYAKHYRTKCVKILGEEKKLVNIDGDNKEFIQPIFTLKNEYISIFSKEPQ